MAFDRYSSSDLIGFGQLIGTSRAHVIIRNAVISNSIGFETITLRGAERLDTVAGRYYGDGRYWWLIAAASGIGWGLQAPPGTVLNIPNLAQAARLVV